MLRLFPVFRRLRSGSLIRKVVGNTLWQITSRVLRLIINLIVGIWVARYLGPSQFGLLNFAIAFVALFSPISDLGVQAIIVRDLVRRPEGRVLIISSALALRLIGGGLAVAMASIYFCVSRPDDWLSHLIVFAIALSLIPQAWDVIDFDYQARMHAWPIAVIRMVSLLVFAAARGGLIIERANLIWFAVVILGEAAASALLMWTVFKPQLPQFSIFSAKAAEMKCMLRSSWPLAVTGMSVLLYMRVDQVMIDQMAGDHAVGIFSAAVRVSESWLFIPIALLAAAAPVLTMELRRSETRYIQRLIQFTRVMFVVSVAFAAALTFWSHQLIEFLYGDKYVEASSVLEIHAWAGVFASLGLAGDPWFINAEMLKVRMIYTIIGTAINVALNLYLIPRFGVFGSAVATLISYSVTGFWLNALNQRTRPLFIVQAKACLPFLLE